MRYLKSPTRVATQKVATSRATRTGTDIVEKTTLRSVVPGLILYYNFLHGSIAPSGGTYYFEDLSNNGKHATLVNAPTRGPGYITFDGVNDYATVANTYSTPTLPTGEDPRTIVALFSPTVVGNYLHIAHYGTNTANQAYGINHTVVQNRSYGTHTWGGCAAMGAPTTDDNFNFVAVMYDSSNQHTGYQDGVAYDSASMRFGQGKTTQYSINTGSTWDLHVGMRIAPLGEPFAGDLYALLIYNRVLSTRELDHLYNTFKSSYGF